MDGLSVRMDHDSICKEIAIARWRTGQSGKTIGSVRSRERGPEGLESDKVRRTRETRREGKRRRVARAPPRRKRTGNGTVQERTLRTSASAAALPEQKQNRTGISGAPRGEQRIGYLVTAGGRPEAEVWDHDRRRSLGLE